MFNNLSYHSISLFLHAFVIGVFLFYSKVFNSISTVDPSNVNKIRTVGKAIKVDVVAMPRMTIKELQALESAAPGKPEETKPVKKVEDTGGDEKTIFKKTTKKLSLSERLKKLSQRRVKTKKTRKSPTKKKEEGNEGISGTRLKKILALGNKLQEGQALTGDNVGNSGDLFDQYAVLITDIVRANWKLPAYLADKDLRCTIQLFISKTGQVIRTKKITSSGNEDYDDFALSAIKKVESLPAPDKAILSRVLSGEIALAFPL